MVKKNKEDIRRGDLKNNLLRNVWINIFYQWIILLDLLIKEEKDSDFINYFDSFVESMGKDILDNRIIWIIKDWLYISDDSIKDMPIYLLKKKEKDTWNDIKIFVSTSFLIIDVDINEHKYNWIETYQNILKNFIAILSKKKYSSHLIINKIEIRKLNSYAPPKKQKESFFENLLISEKIFKWYNLFRSDNIMAFFNDKIFYFLSLSQKEWKIDWEIGHITYLFIRWLYQQDILCSESGKFNKEVGEWFTKINDWVFDLFKKSITEENLCLNLKKNV